MPYKYRERKRQWEREHRDERNARRRMQRLDARSGHQIIPKPEPGPVSGEKSQGTWKTILGLVVGIGVVLLTVFASVNPPTLGDLGESPGAGNSGV
jgi:ferric-dicitrate binding protein FerR (iron transport regulator)